MYFTIADRKYRDYLLSYPQQDLLKRVVDALSPYKCLTDLLSGENVPTSSSICEVLRILKDLCLSVDGDDEEEATAVNQIRHKIWAYADERLVKYKNLSCFSYIF